MNVLYSSVERCKHWSKLMLKKVKYLLNASVRNKKVSSSHELLIKSFSLNAKEQRNSSPFMMENKQMPSNLNELKMRDKKSSYSD